MSKSPKPVVVVPVPSGKLVFANDLRCLTGHVKNYSVNTDRGTAAMSLQYSLYGVGHIFVGNTSPCVVRDAEGLNVEVGSDRQRDELGTIDTSLWWYSAIDFDTFTHRCAALNVDPGSLNTFTVDVKPGVYAFTDEMADPDAGDVVLSKIRWLPFEIDDLHQTEPNFSPAACFTQSQIWKEISQSEYGANAWLEDMFTVLGNGYRWHHGQLINLDGHEIDTPFRGKLPLNANIGDVLDRIPALPNFTPGMRGMRMSYPLYRNYPKLGAAPLHADPHALAAGMMFIKSMLEADITIMGAEKKDATQNAASIEAYHTQLRDELAVAVKIAEKRGLFKDGTLDHIFEEILTALTPAPENTPGM